MGEGGWGVDKIFFQRRSSSSGAVGERLQAEHGGEGATVGRHARGIASLSGLAKHYPASRIFLEDGDSCGGHVLSYPFSAAC